MKHSNREEQEKLYAQQLKEAKLKKIEELKNQEEQTEENQEKKSRKRYRGYCCLGIIVLALVSCGFLYYVYGQISDKVTDKVLEKTQIEIKRTEER